MKNLQKLKEGKPNIDGRSKNGGKGNVGAKKKPESDKKIPVAFYAKCSEIQALGGLEIARAIAKKGFQKELKNKSKKDF